MALVCFSDGSCIAIPTYLRDNPLVISARVHLTDALHHKTAAAAQLDAVVNNNDTLSLGRYAEALAPQPDHPSSTPLLSSPLRDLPLITLALSALVLFDLLALGGTERIHTFTHRRRVALRRPDNWLERVFRAIAVASVFYVHPVGAFQRCAVATWLLRAGGIPADLVIGHREIPFKWSVWVEVAGAVAGDVIDYPRYLTVVTRL